MRLNLWRSFVLLTALRNCNMKRIFAILMVFALILLCGCKAAEETPESTGQVIGFGGAEDSIFDDEGEETTAPVETQDPATEDPTEDPTEEPVESETSGATEPEPSAPTQTEPPADDTEPDFSMTYEKFNALSAKEKREYQESFADLDAFFAWYEAEKARYEEENPPIIIGGDGQIVLP